MHITFRCGAASLQPSKRIAHVANGVLEALEAQGHKHLLVAKPSHTQERDESKYDSSRLRLHHLDPGSCAKGLQRKRVERVFCKPRSCRSSP